MADEEPENWFGNVSLPLFPERRQKALPVWLRRRRIGPPS
jgi:hypothetical protein